MIALNDRTRLTDSLGTFIFAYINSEKDDMEEFVPVAEELAVKLIDIIENSDFDDEYDDDEEE